MRSISSRRFAPAFAVYVCPRVAQIVEVHAGQAPFLIAGGQARRVI
jgi:hypothetical protein